MSLLLSTSRTGPVDGDPPTVAAADARRLSAIQREAATLALAALHRSGTARPDAIIVSTALGCLDDTERFLADMHDAKGALLSPLPFMRSTHTTMAGQLALMLRCHGPNITHSQGCDGFHTSLVEAELLLHEHPEWRILVLAIDENTDLLDRMTGILCPDTAAGWGGEAFVLTGATDAPCIARIEWNAGTADVNEDTDNDEDEVGDPEDGVHLLPGEEHPLHGALMAERFCELLEAGIPYPLLIGWVDPSTRLIVSPC